MTAGMAQYLVCLQLLVVEKKPWLMNRGGRGFMGRGGGRGDGPRGGFRGRMDSRGPPPGRGRGGFPSDIGGRWAHDKRHGRS